MRIVFRSIISAIFSWVALLVWVGHVHAGQADVIPTIHVRATGSTQLAPDMAVLTLSVVRTGKTAREALDANNGAMKRVMDNLEQQGIEKKDLQTANFNIQPRYERRKTSGANSRQPQIIGYNVSNSLTLRIRNLEKLGEILDRVVTLGVNSGGNVRFTNADPSIAISSARTQAMKNAIAKARTLVAAAGARLGDLLLISENTNTSRPIPISMARSAFKAQDGANVPVASGENSYSVTIEVKWRIE